MWELTNDPETNRAVMTSQGPIKIQPNHLIPVNTNRQDAAKAYNAITSLEEQEKRKNYANGYGYEKSNTVEIEAVFTIV